MQAVILAAGKSTRTYPLTLTKPKPLLKIINKELIKHNLDELHGIINEVILIVGYRSEMIKEHIGNSYRGIKIIYIEQKEQNGTGGAIICAKHILKDKFIVMNGDDLFSNEDIKKCIKHDYCILVKEVNDIYRFGEIIINNKNNNVIDIIEKPNKDNGLANTGLYVFSKKIFDYNLKKSKRNEYEIVDYIKFLNEDNLKINYEIVNQYWIPITYAWNLLDANDFFLSKIKSKNSAIIEENVTIKGEVIIGKDTLVKSGSYIEGPAIIGNDCVIGPNCYIRKNSTIGNFSKIGNAVEIKNTIIGERTNINHLSYVGDSVIGDNVNFGAGTITANLRHDNNSIKTPLKGKIIDTKRRKLGTIVGDGVHTGINTSIYPGRKLAPDSTTLPGEIISKDIE